MRAICAQASGTRYQVGKHIKSPETQTGGRTFLEFLTGELSNKWLFLSNIFYVTLLSYVWSPSPCSYKDWALFFFCFVLCLPSSPLVSQWVRERAGVDYAPPQTRPNRDRPNKAPDRGPPGPCRSGQGFLTLLWLNFHKQPKSLKLALHTVTHIHTYTHTHIHTYTHTHRYSKNNTHMNLQAHTHTHTHTYTRL